MDTKYPFFSPLYNILLTDKNLLKLLEYIMINTSITMVILIVLQNNNSRIDVLNEIDV